MMLTKLLIALTDGNYCVLVVGKCCATVGDGGKVSYVRIHSPTSIALRVVFCLNEADLQHHCVFAMHAIRPVRSSSSENYSKAAACWQNEVNTRSPVKALTIYQFAPHACLFFLDFHRAMLIIEFSRME